MTMTECVIELASAMELGLLVAHHPIADAASSGGVPLVQYLPLYDLAVIEMHEAFHGLHPGIAYLHGHQKVKVDTCFAGIQGNVLIKGEALPGIETVGDILDHLQRHMGEKREQELLAVEQWIRESPTLVESATANPPQLLHGRAVGGNGRHCLRRTGNRHLHSKPGGR